MVTVDIESLEEIAEQMDIHVDTKSPAGCIISRRSRRRVPPKIVRLFGRSKGRKKKVTLASLEQSNG